MEKEGMIFVVYDDSFLCEYYGSDSTARVWSQANAPLDSVKDALELAKALLKDYHAFYLVFVDADNNDYGILLDPAADNIDSLDSLFNDYDAFEDTAMMLYESLYSAKAR